MSIHPTAKIGKFVDIDPTASVGENSVIWSHCRILANVVIGKNVSIGGGTEIGKGSVIGDGTRISTQCFLPSNSIIGKGCFLAPGVKCADDLHPRANNSHYEAKPPVIDDGASVGMNSTLLPGVHVGVGAMIGAGSVVTRDVPAHEHVRGEPARVKPYSRIQTETKFDIYAASIRDRVIAGESVKEN
jgi:UDP-2-acetamido-3-amino-2,3-dideoxy-glucuronate N-acetyltransferase